MLELSLNIFTPLTPPSSYLSSSTFTTDNDGLVLSFQISFEVTKSFLTNSKYMRRVVLQWDRIKMKKFTRAFPVGDCVSIMK